MIPGYETVCARWFGLAFLGWLGDPFKGLSDLQVRDEKVTLNHLVMAFMCEALLVSGKGTKKRMGPSISPYLPIIFQVWLVLQESTM